MGRSFQIMGGSFQMSAEFISGHIWGRSKMAASFVSCLQIREGLNWHERLYFSNQVKLNTYTLSENNWLYPELVWALLLFCLLQAEPN